MPSPSTEAYQYISAKRPDMQRMTYTGPNHILKGSTALVKLEGDKAMAQFDNKDRGRLCFGWHEFKASDFTPIEEPKYAEGLMFRRQAEDRIYRHSYTPGHVVMIEMSELDNDDRVKKLLALKADAIKGMSNFVHITAPTGAVPNV